MKEVSEEGGRKRREAEDELKRDAVRSERNGRWRASIDRNIDINRIGVEKSILTGKGESSRLKGTSDRF